MHNLARFGLRLFARMEVSGVENIPASGVTMMIMNHLHWLDPVIGVAIVERPAVMFTADKWEHRPVIGDVIRWSQRAIFVARGEPDRQALAQAIEVLKRGDILAVAPEGTRSKTGALQEARDGAAYLASRTGATIVPVTAYGQELAERRWKRLRRPHIVVTVGEPFFLEGTPNKARGQQRALYTEEMMLRLARMLPPEYRGVYSDKVA
ncbi:MAG TPA: lysophospholipid acyltransferase family protein [Anaerolineae bacterium]|nr:lysophospholipid acyltransferase family protein [Anaerolineae bacterium]